MYGREVDGQELSFGHEGVLYRNSFVMYDKGTDSKWLHVTGEALKGPLKGKRLAFLPSEVVPWRLWLQKHPASKALLGERANSFMGNFGIKNRINRYGLSVGQGREVTLFRYSLLQRVPVLNTEVGSGAVLLCFDPEGVYALAFSRLYQGKTLHFELVLPEKAIQSPPC